MASIHAAPLRSHSLSALLLLTLPAVATAQQCLSWDAGLGPSGAGLRPPTVLPAGLVAPEVRALLVHDDGSGPKLYAGGRFTTAAGLVREGIARWDGSAWSAVGGPSAIGVQQVHSLCAFDEGAGLRLFAGGLPTNVGGVPSTLARWDGNAWTDVGGGVLYSGPDFGVAAMAVHDDGSGPALYVGGDVGLIGPFPVSDQLIARWNGSSFSSLGTGLGQTFPFAAAVEALASFDAGAGAQLYAGGRLLSSPAESGELMRWDGNSWHAIPDLSALEVRALTVFDDGSGPALYVGGRISSAGGTVVANIARWNGSTWSSVGAGLSANSGGVFALARFDDGNGPALYAAGSFPGGVARWDGSHWSVLAGSFVDPGSGALGGVRALASFDAGAGAGLYAGGYFTAVGTIPSVGIAEWHGCHASPAAFCAGDGGEIECPCNNNGLAGRGCQNSAGTGGALLAATGTTNPDTLVLGTSGMLASAPAIVLQGDQALGFVPFGDGLRCIGGHLKRLYVAVASSGAASVPAPGQPSVSARSAALGDPLAPGAVRFYQTQYRDPIASFCASGGTFNASSALRVVW